MHRHPAQLPDQFLESLIDVFIAASWGTFCNVVQQPVYLTSGALHPLRLLSPSFFSCAADAIPEPLEDAAAARCAGKEGDGSISVPLAADTTRLVSCAICQEV